MREKHRKLYMSAWWELFALDQGQHQAEDKYFQLLSAADDMERRQLITSDEWRYLIRRAGTCLSDGSEGFDLIGMLKARRAPQDS